MADDLLRFLCPDAGKIQILVLNSTVYLQRLRILLPNADIEAVTAYDEVPRFKANQQLDVHWTMADYRSEELPFAARSFDIILAEGCLEEAFQPYTTLMELNRWLKETGFLLTQFPNIRHWRILQDLQRGEFQVREQHFYAKTEVVRLLNDTLYKEIIFAPRGQEISDEAAVWENMGFDNYSHDLETEIWMVKAMRSSAAVAALKSLYDAATRRHLSQLLHRLEYDIDTASSLEALWQLCREKTIFAAYLADFVHEATIHQARVYKIIADSAKSRHLDDFLAEFSSRQS